MNHANNATRDAAGWTGVAEWVLMLALVAAPLVALAGGAASLSGL